MRRTEHGWIDHVFRVIAALGMIYLLLPILMMFPLSLESGRILRFPPNTVSLHWYADYFASAPWISSTLLSIKVALGASCIATVLGTLAAIGLARTSTRLRHVATLILLSPIFLPTIVIAIAIYGVYASLRMVGTPLGLVLAHGVLTLPLVLLNVSAALSAVPRSMEEAAMSLGAGPVATFLQVTAPLIFRGIVAGAVFSLLVSFDEVVIATFISGTQATTLPVRMFTGVFYEMTPMLAAISCMLVMLNVVLCIVGQALARWRSSPPP